MAGVRLGFEPVTKLAHYDIYKTYQEFRDAGENKAKAMQSVAKFWRVEYSTVRRVIIWFEEDVTIEEPDFCKRLQINVA